jgi:pimeloyl-ACP methyl ester carboxylesterase
MDMSLDLALGATHCELAGPESGPWVLLLHGGTVPMWCWDGIAAALQAAGFRTLRYDMYGKGGSAMPPPSVHALYDRAFFQRQLRDVLAAVGAPEKLHVVGFSFGGVTAANFALAHPEKVHSLSLIAPAYHSARTNTLVQVARLPLIGRSLVKRLVLGKGAQRAALLWQGHHQAQRYGELFAQQVVQEGFVPAIAAFLRSDALDSYASTFAALGQRRQAALLIYGSRDEDVPSTDMQELRQLMPDVTYQELPGISHGVPFQASQLVAAPLIDYMRRQAQLSVSSDATNAAHR